MESSHIYSFILLVLLVLSLVYTTIALRLLRNISSVALYDTMVPFML